MERKKSTFQLRWAPQQNTFIGYLGISYNAPWSQSSKVHPPTFVPFPQKKKNTTSSIGVAHTLTGAWTNSQWLVPYFGGVYLPQKPSMFLILNYQSAVIDTTAKESFLPLAAKESQDHGLPRGFWQQNGKRAINGSTD